MSRIFQLGKYAVRMLLRTPGFTAIAVLSLVIGIGANSAIFTIANAVAIAPTPGLPSRDGLVDIGRTVRGKGFDTVSYVTFKDVRDRTDVFESVFAYGFEPKAMSLGRDIGADVVYAQLVTGGYFDTLGLKPALGTFFRATDEKTGVPLRAVILSHAFWRDHFAGDRTLVGRTITLNGSAFTVLGVAPERFLGTSVISTDIWVPVTAMVRGLPDEQMLAGRENNGFMMGARLKKGVSLAQAQQAVNACVAGLIAEYPGIYRNWGLAVNAQSRVPGEAGDFTALFLVLLMSLVGLVLLVACTNLAGLLLARAASRSREIAVRLALGASRGQVIAMLLAESLLVFIVGAAAGLWLAQGLMVLCGRMLSIVPVALSLDLHLDWRVVLFTSLVAVVTGLATGLVPALQATRVDLTSGLKADLGSPRRFRLRQTVMGVQITFGLVLMILAGLLIRGLHAASRVDPGFDLGLIDVASIDLSLGGYPDSRAPEIAETLRERMAALPGVEAVGVGRVVALDGGGLGLGGLRRPGANGAAANINTDWNIVSPNYLPAIGIPLVGGRNFDASDHAQAGRVAIINEHFARHIFPNENPVGLWLETGDFRPGREATIERITIVGVARDAKYRSLDESPRDFIYVPLAQTPSRRLSFFVRQARSGASGQLQPLVRDVLSRFDRNLPLVSYAPHQQFADVSLLPQRFAAQLAGALGVVALLLAAVGIYGVAAFSVASRTKEIGLRIALGADRARVRWLIVRQTLKILMIGGIAGAGLALAIAPLLVEVLFGVSPVDPLTFGVTTTMLALVVIGASLVPAERAARVQPIVALRQQ